MITALFGRLVIQRLVNSGIKQATLLDTSTKDSTWDRMVRNDKPGSSPDMLFVFMYNITNLPEVHKGAKPHLEEVGPYVYRKTRIKENVRFSRGGHVSFNEFLTFDGGSACDGPEAHAHPSSPLHTADTTSRSPSSAVLWPGASAGRRGGIAVDAPHGLHQHPQPAAGSLSDITPEKYGRPRCGRDDVITTLNLPLLGVLRTVDKASRFKAFVEIAIKQFFSQQKESGTFDGLFMRRTAEELLFGYEDELISAVAHLVPSLQEKAVFKLMPNMTHPEDAFPQNIMSTRPTRGPPHTGPFNAASDRSDATTPLLSTSARSLHASDDDAIAANTSPLLGPPGLAASDDRTTAPARERSATAEGARGWLEWLEELWEAAVVRPVRRIAAALHSWANPPLPGWSYVEWQQHDAVSCWADGHEERVAGGSDALQFPPGLKPSDPIFVYVPELFRMARLNVTGELSVRGVRLLEYKPDEHVAAPDPRFFTEITGLMNVTACTAVGPTGDAADAAGPPVLMSFPHFCHVDPAVAAQTTGVTPCNSTLHDLWLGVEPNTGITMAARKRLQVSSAFDGRHSSFDRDVRPTILPIFWAEEAGELGETQAEQIRTQLYPALQAIRVLGGRPFWLSCAAVAVLLLCVMGILVVWRPQGGRSAGTAAGEPGGGAAASRNGERHGLAAAAAAAAAAAQAAAANGSAAASAPQAAVQSEASEPGVEVAPGAADKHAASCTNAWRAEAAASAPAPPQPAAAAVAPEEPAHSADGSATLAPDPQHLHLREAAARAAREAPAEAAVPFLLEAGWEGGMAAGSAPVSPRAPATEPPGSPSLSVRSSRLGSDAVRSHIVRIDSMY